MKQQDKSETLAFVLTTFAIAALVAFASYISFYAGEKYGIAITEKKFNQQNNYE